MITGNNRDKNTAMKSIGKIEKTLTKVDNVQKWTYIGQEKIEDATEIR